MAMNSAPSSRYSTASEPITPTSERALEIGCVCTTTLMAHTTAINAKRRKENVHVLELDQGHQKAVTSRFTAPPGTGTSRRNPSVGRNGSAAAFREPR